MLRLLFPPALDTNFRGQWLGFWLLAPVLFLKIGIGIGSLVAPQRANQADALDHSTYSPAALREALATTALLGLLHLCIAAFGVLAMARYRAMVPLIYLGLIAEMLARRVVLGAYPIDRVAGPSSGGIVNLVLIALMVVGLGLSLWPRRNAPA
jgi:hypothetical protein